MEVRIVDGTAYYTNPVNGEWDSAPHELMPLNLTHLGRNVARILGEMDNLSAISAGKVGSETVHRMKGAIPSEAFDLLVNRVTRGESIDAELWVDREVWMVRRIILTGAIFDGDREGNARVLKLSKFGEPVVIEAPSLFRLSENP